MSFKRTKIGEHINERLKSKKVLLMGHVLVGYPSVEENRAMLQIMKEAGVDLVELQMPFSEPIADGPDFVKANHSAIENGMLHSTYLEFMRSVSELQILMVAMGYYNWPFTKGSEEFAKGLQESGALGYIVPDLPPEEDDELRTHCESRDISPILLMTPTNTDERLAEIAEKSEGFVYCVARKGVTGPRTTVEDAFEFVARCRRATPLPLALGFGLTKGEDIRKLHGQVEIAIVGTKLLQVWKVLGDEGYRNLLKELTAACYA